MRAARCVGVVVAIALGHLTAAEPTNPKAEAVLAEYDEARAEHAAELAEDVAAARAALDAAVARDRERALRELKRLISHRSGVAEQALVYRAVLQLDRDDADAHAFFGAIGTLDDELAALGPAPEPVAPAIAADLLAATATATAADPGALVVAISEWDHRGVWHNPGNYPGLLLAPANRPIRLELEMPGGPCYLHVRYAANSPRPTELWIGGVLAAEAVAGAATGGAQLQHLAWDTVGPISPPAGTVALELRCPTSSPHFRGVVVSRSAQPPTVDPFAE